VALVPEETASTVAADEAIGIPAKKQRMIRLRRITEYFHRMGTGITVSFKKIDGFLSFLS
jgi:hypothetical protein